MRHCLVLLARPVLTRGVHGRTVGQFKVDVAQANDQQDAAAAVSFGDRIDAGLQPGRDDLFGTGASNNVLGFAGPECGTYSPPVITEGSAVLNGKFVDGIDTSSNPEISLAEFTRSSAPIFHRSRCTTYLQSEPPYTDEEC